MLNRLAFVLATVLALTLACTALVAQEWNFVPPEGSGVVNVKDHGAIGDGVADDTEALRAAVRAAIDVSRYRANPFVYLPKGTYKVSGPIEGRKGGKGDWSAGWLSMMLMLGESRTDTVIKLADSAEGYGDASKPRWVLACGSEGDKRDNEGGGGNRAFRHGFLNFTVDVGQGNPGAIAIDFIASNRGTIEGVTLRAPEGSGHTAIGLTRHWPGPAFVGDVRIDGFAYGMRLDHYQYGMTFENITMRGQTKAGITNTNNMLALRRVDFSGNVPFYRGSGGHSFISLLDSTLVNEGGEHAALTSEGFVNLRRVSFTGYPVIVDDTRKPNEDLAGDGAKKVVIASHDIGATWSQAGEVKPLDLPIEDTPYLRPSARATWTVVSGTGADVQKAIDDGAEWIAVRGKITLEEPVVLRNKVQLLFGLHGHFAGLGGKVAVRVENGSAKTVIMEHIYVDGIIEQASNRTFALRHGDHGGFHATGTGTSHILDVIGKDYQIGKDHRFFARQLNAEFGGEPLFTNAGTSVIIGFKMESSTRGGKDKSEGTPSLHNKDGGRLELFAGLLYTLGSKAEHRPAVPAFTNEKGAIAISYRHNGIPATWYDQILRIGSDDSATMFTNKDIGGHGRALLVDQR